jgi:uncharacterized protein YlxP (DUF503 family)
MARERGHGAGSGGAARVFVGVLAVELRVPGARTLKDRRQTVVALRDRMRHAFDVSVHELTDTEDPQSARIVCTTAGNDRRTIESILGRCAELVRTHPVAQPGRIDLDVFRWHPSADSWEARMMAEVGARTGDGEE